MAKTDENLLHLGADLDRDFVLSFRDYCRLNDFKQKTLIQRLVEFWFAQEPIRQEHIYRGRLKDAETNGAEFKSMDNPEDACRKIVQDVLNELGVPHVKSKRPRRAKPSKPLKSP